MIRRRLRGRVGLLWGAGTLAAIVTAASMSGQGTPSVRSTATETSARRRSRLGHLQRGDSGVPAHRRRREHVGRARRVPVRLEEDDGRLHHPDPNPVPLQGVDPHRKAGVARPAHPGRRSAYVDGVVHGDGLTSLQFRRTKGAITEQTSGREGRGRRPA